MQQKKGTHRKIALITPIMVIGLIWGSIIFFACKEKNFSKAEYGYITYSINWDSILDQDMHKETLRFCFYPADNGPMIQTDTDSCSLKIALSPGKYGLLVYNYEENHFHLRNRSHLNQTEVVLETDENGLSRTPSSHLYGVVIKEFEVFPNQDVETILTPTLFTKRVFFQIDLDGDEEGIQNCEGLLAGVTPQLHLSNRTSKRDTTTKIPLILEKQDSCYYGQLLLFDGKYEGKDIEKNSHELTLHFTLNNGNRVSSVLDMEGALFHLKNDILVDIGASLHLHPETSIELLCRSINSHTDD